MTILSIIFIFLFYRWYLYYKKQNDKHAIENSRKIYLDGFFSQHFEYYKLLPKVEQQTFVNRSLEVRSSMFFTQVNDLIIAENIKTLISASFTQLTFGFDQPLFNQILKKLEKTQTDFVSWLKNEATSLSIKKGRIEWTWEEFTNGYMFGIEKRNLILQHLAITLCEEGLQKNDKLEAKFKSWLQTANTLSSQNQNSEESLVKEFQLQSTPVFFAQVVEHFFEHTQQLQQQLPQLYLATADLLQQDLFQKKEL